MANAPPIAGERSPDMNDVFSLALPFFGLIFLGFGAGKLVDLPEAGLAWLNFFVVYCALPALFFQLLSKTPIDQIANWGFVFGTTFSTYVAFALAFCAGVLVTGGQIREATVQGLIGAYSNIGYMGPGLTLATLGIASTVPTALIFCFDNALLFMLAAFLMAIGGTEQRSTADLLLTALRKLFLHPFIIATILGVAAAAVELQLPTALNKFLSFLSSAAAPCALFAMGVSVALRPIRRVPTELPILLLIKLILHPLIVYLVLIWLGGIDPLWIKTAVLMACLPPAANVFVLASQYETYIERASSAILIGTVVSVTTVSAVLYLIVRDLIPGL